MKKRLFVAVPLSPQFHKDISEWLKEIKSNLNKPSIRWTPSENFHLTICFLGGVEENLTSGIEKTLKETVSQIFPFNLKFKQVRWAPASSPRMIWAVFAPNSDFNQLVKKVAWALVAHHKIKLLPDRPIIPHVTLARIKNRLKPEALLEVRLANHTLQVTTCELWASKTLPSGAVYTKLASFPLGRQP